MAECPADDRDRLPATHIHPTEIDELEPIVTLKHGVGLSVQVAATRHYLPDRGSNIERNAPHPTPANVFEKPKYAAGFEYSNDFRERVVEPGDRTKHERGHDCIEGFIGKWK